MDYQPGPSPGQASRLIPPPILQTASEVAPYDHSRYGMVNLTILSLAEVVVPHLGAYHPLTAGMLYLSRSLPFLYWALCCGTLMGGLRPWHLGMALHPAMTYLGCGRSQMVAALKKAACHLRSGNGSGNPFYI
ncbi:hypothetical protein DSO57_1031839 [Entomophthora muscae]|uniref:Uncharacterized protein n=1 Tax=Entomophthora muscae TaxID=34485 RepID=A0ACC2TMX0_9FUNG|nr:hypothetical protein DSO57_1031839 [Entomophthora muscae]